MVGRSPTLACSVEKVCDAVGPYLYPSDKISQTGALAAQLEAAVEAGEADAIQTALASITTELPRVGAGLERLDEGEHPAVAG